MTTVLSPDRKYRPSKSQWFLKPELVRQIKMQHAPLWVITPRAWGLTEWITAPTELARRQDLHMNDTGSLHRLSGSGFRGAKPRTLPVIVSDVNPPAGAS